MLRDPLWNIQHNVTCENAVGELSWLLTTINLGASKIVCLYGMLDSHRQMFTTVHGATWLMTIAKCACSVNVTFMLLFMETVIFIVGHCADVSVVYLFLQKQRFNFTYYAAVILCVFALTSRCSAVSSASDCS